MKKLLSGIFIGVLGAIAWQRYMHPAVRADAVDQTRAVDAGELEVESTAGERADFKCDGRVYCSEMTSCEEAMYFLHNCPGVKMDGEGDGIPCEKQWCGRD
jgi:hypothetical protein